MLKMNVCSNFLKWFRKTISSALPFENNLKGEIYACMFEKKKVLNQPQVGLELSGHELLAPITSNKNG